MDYKEQQGQWMVSNDDEHWNELEFFDTPEQAIAYGRELYKETQETFFIGQLKTVSIMADDLAEEVIEMISYRHVNNDGEHAESYLMNVDDEHRGILDERLEKVISRWAEEFGYNPNYFMVENIKEIE